MAKAQAISLTEADRSYLESITRTRTLQSQVVTRARMLLLKANGESIDSSNTDNTDSNENFSADNSSEQQYEINASADYYTFYFVIYHQY